MLQPQALVQWSAPDPLDGSNPYSWKHDPPAWIFALSAQVSGLRRHPWEQFGTGISVTARGSHILSSAWSSKPRAEGLLQAALELPLFPLRIRLYGILDGNLMSLDGNSRGKVLAPLSAGIGMTEYCNSRSPQILEWLAGGEAEAGLFRLEIQNSISHIYFNRFSGSLAYRGAFFHDPRSLAGAGVPLGAGPFYVHSLAGRITLEASVLPAALMPCTLSFTGAAVLKLSGPDGGFSMDNFAFQFGWTFSFN
jgi:hypothetical protein